MPRKSNKVAPPPPVIDSDDSDNESVVTVPVDSDSECETFTTRRKVVDSDSDSDDEDIVNTPKVIQVSDDDDTPPAVLKTPVGNKKKTPPKVPGAPRKPSKKKSSVPVVTKEAMNAEWKIFVNAIYEILDGDDGFMDHIDKFSRTLESFIENSSSSSSTTPTKSKRGSNGGEKRTRKPTAYNKFVSVKMSELKEDVNLKASDRLSMAAKMWKEMTKEDKDSFIAENM